MDISWYPQLPESMTDGKTPEEIEEIKATIRGHIAIQTGLVPRKWVSREELEKMYPYADR